MRALLIEIGLVVAVAVGIGVGYFLWGLPTNWYAVAEVDKLGPGPENDLIRYGKDLIVNTPRYIGKSATDPAMHYAGNDLACQSCHLNAGLQPFAAPFVSTFATFPMMVDDQVLTLTQRINGCMIRSMNGKELPDEGREMEALIAYFKFIGKGSPEGVRIPGMGLLPDPEPDLAARCEARGGRLRQALRHLPQGGRPGRAASTARHRLQHPAALGRHQLQCGGRHGQDRLCRLLYPRQHAIRHQLPDAGAHGAAGLGRGGLYHLQAASGGAGRGLLAAALGGAGVHFVCFTRSGVAKRMMAWINSCGRSSDRK